MAKVLPLTPEVESGIRTTVQAWPSQQIGIMASEIMALFATLDACRAERAAAIARAEDLLIEQKGMQATIDEAEETLACFALMASAYDDRDYNEVVSQVGHQSIRVGAFREARDYYFGRLSDELKLAEARRLRAENEKEGERG